MRAKADTRSFQTPPEFANDTAQRCASMFFARVAPYQSEQALSGFGGGFRKRNIPEHSASLETSKVHDLPVETKKR